MEEKESMILGPATLYRLVGEKLKPWRTPNGDVFVDVWLDDLRHTVPVKSEAFTGILYLLAQRVAPGKLPSGNALEEMKAYCIGTALASQRILPAFVRVGGTSGDLYYDFGDDTREMARWKEGKWEVVRTTGEVPRFYRPNGMLPQVRPHGNGGLVELLRKHVRCREDDIYLLAAWLVGAFKVGGPFPILIINGEQGSSKSTTTRLLRRLVDPHARDMREPPTNSRDLVAAVKNAYVVAVDNVSTLQHNLSDSLCRISTGTGALGGRALYTDSDEAAFTACRPIVLNGIPAFAEREDLVSRSINVELPSIPPSQRMDDDTFWHLFEEDMPRILGAIFDCVGKAQMGFSSVRLSEAPRMANFARWAYAGLGEEAGNLFLAAYSNNKMEASAHFVEHNDVAQALISLMKEKEVWYGSWAQLLAVLTPLAAPTKFWPENSLQLRNRMIRISEDLRKCGLEWRKNGRESRSGRSCVEVRRLKSFIGNHVLTSVT
jgi:putative DNA primase/helicase